MVHRLWTFCEQVPCVLLNPDATDYSWVYRDELSQYKFIGNVGEDIMVAMEECIDKYKNLAM